MPEIIDAEFTVVSEPKPPAAVRYRKVWRLTLTPGTWQVALASAALAALSAFSSHSH